MKVILVGPAHPLRGGIAHHTGSLATALVEEGHSIRVLSFKRQYPGWLFPGKSQTDPEANPWNIEAEPLVDSIDPVSWRRASSFVLGFDPALVVFQWWQPFLAPAYSSIIRRLKKHRPETRVLFVCHNVYSHERTRLLGSRSLQRIFNRAVLRRPDGFLVHASPLIQELREFNPGVPIQYVPHPVYDFYQQWDPGPIDRDRTETHLLFFGKIRSHKGLEVLLAAFSRLVAQFPIRLTIAGEFYVSEEKMRRLAREFNVDSNIRWRPEYISNAEVPLLFRSADAVVLPYSRATQSGIVPVAYQFEVPVIASAAGGLPDLIRDGKTGFLFPPGDAEALAGCISDFLRREDREVFKQEIRKVRNEMTWKRLVAAILNLYH